MVAAKTIETYDKVDERQLDFVYELFRAIAHPLRIEIMNYIGKKGETNVQSIYHSLDIPQSVTSQQLKILKDVGLVKFKRHSKERIYSVNYELLGSVQQCIKTYF
jgi:ArsR family transcriptional regulator